MVHQIRKISRLEFLRFLVLSVVYRCCGLWNQVIPLRAPYLPSVQVEQWFGKAVPKVFVEEKSFELFQGVFFSYPGRCRRSLPIKCVNNIRFEY